VYRKQDNFFVVTPTKSLLWERFSLHLSRRPEAAHNKHELKPVAKKKMHLTTLNV